MKFKKKKLVKKKGTKLKRIEFKTRRLKIIITNEFYFKTYHLKTQSSREFTIHGIRQCCASSLSILYLESKKKIISVNISKLFHIILVEALQCNASVKY